MVVAVIAVRVMQPAVHEIIGVAAMRHGLVPATGAMMMLRRMAVVKSWRTIRGVFGVDVDPVLHDAAGFLVLQMALRKVVDVAVVVDRLVSARGAVNVLLSW
jgi:hypothetical protein